MIRIVIEWLLLSAVTVAVLAELEDDNESFERVDISSIDLNEIDPASGQFTKNEESGRNQEKDKVEQFPTRNPPVDTTDSTHRNCTGYGFFRSLGARGHWQDTRRVFGGATTRLEDYPEVCILLDRFMAPRCSGSVLTRYWILTAAHCITPNLGFAKYNTRTPMRTDVGDVVALRYLYKHPDYKVVQEDVGRGMDVTVLNHDLGLAHTRAPMALAQHSPVPPLRAILSYDPNQLFGEEVQVLGFGRTEASNKGEELLTVFLRLVECDRNGWRHCVCGVSRSLELPSGVCSGDSGGPVVYRGVQIGVTSMGPLSCASDANETFPLGATSVFTAVFPYRDIINRTIREADSSMRRSVPTSSAPTIAAKFIATLANIILLVETNIIFV